MLSSYLVRRGKTGIWQLRVPVPRPLWSVVGKREHIASLRTTDRRIAEHAAVPIIAAWRAAWRKETPLETNGYAAPLDPLALAVQVGFDGMLAALEDQQRDWASDDPSYSVGMAQREADLRRFSRSIREGDLRRWEAVADRLINRHKLAVEQGSDGYRRFVETLGTANVDALWVFLRRAGGDLDAKPRTEIVRQAKTTGAMRARSGETITELFERWSRERLAKGEKRADTVAQDRKVIAQFAGFVGVDRDIRSITPVEIAEYRDLLRALPPKWRANKALAGLGLRAAAVKARQLALPESAFTSVNKHLSTISPLYRWLAAQPVWAGLVNPVTGLFHDGVKGKNRRPSFSTEQLNTILRSPLFTGFLADGKEDRPGNVHADDWRKWIPLICLFTGARIGEIAQLRLSDVRQEHGVWFVHIRHDEAAGLRTKSGKSRPAAIHLMLERIGFLAFHQRQILKVEKDVTAPLFPELRPSSRGQISGVPSRFWRDYLAAIGLKNGADGFGSHSFRHTLADRLRSEAEVLNNVVEVALGHNEKTVTSGYGELPQGTVTNYRKWMDAVRWDGVDFAHLIREPV